MKTDVLKFDDLISFHDGRFVKEKIYHGKVAGLDLGCGMWTAWSEKKNKWSKWHVYYFFQGGSTLYTDPILFHQIVENRSLSIAQ